jgi:hypothetical protein
MGGFYSFGLATEVPSGRAAVFEAVATLELTNPVRVWLKRQFGYFLTAFRAGPAALIRLSLKSASVVLKRHFAFIFFVTFLTNLPAHNLKNCMRDEKQNDI